MVDADLYDGLMLLLGGGGTIYMLIFLRPRYWLVFAALLSLATLGALDLWSRHWLGTERIFQ